MIISQCMCDCDASKVIGDSKPENAKTMYYLFVCGHSIKVCLTNGAVLAKVVKSVKKLVSRSTTYLQASHHTHSQSDAVLVLQLFTVPADNNILITVLERWNNNNNSTEWL